MSIFSYWKRNGLFACLYDTVKMRHSSTDALTFVKGSEESAKRLRETATCLNECVIYTAAIKRTFNSAKR